MMRGRRAVVAACILAAAGYASFWSGGGGAALWGAALGQLHTTGAAPTMTSPIFLGSNASKIIARFGSEPKRWLKKGKKGSKSEPPRKGAGRLSRANEDKELWPRPDDVWLVSYPKSGQTWLRFLLGNLLAYDSQQPIDFDTVEGRFPFLEDGSEDWINWAFKAAPSPRIFKSHQPILSPAPQYPCNKKDATGKPRLKMSKVQCLCPNCAHKFRKVVSAVGETVI